MGVASCWETMFTLCFCNCTESNSGELSYNVENANSI